MAEQRVQTIKIVWDGDGAKRKVVEMTRALSDTDKAVDALTKAFGDSATVTAKVTKTQRELAAEARRVVREQERQVAEAKRQQQASENYVESLRQQVRLTSLSADEQEQYIARMKLGANATEAQTREVSRLVTQLQNQRVATGKAGGSMRNFRGIAQNVGWQLQDTVVQLQMGTSAMVVLSQQGSQFASAFGPTGAIIGAVIALAGAFGGVFLSSLLDNTKSAKELDKVMTSLGEVLRLESVSVKGLTDEFKKLYQADKQLAELKLITSLTQAEDATLQLEKQMGKMLDEYLGMAKAVGGNSKFFNFTEAREELGLTEQQFKSLRGEFLKFNTTGDTAGLKNLLIELTQSGEKLSPELKALAIEFVNIDTKSTKAANSLKKLQELTLKGIQPADVSGTSSIEKSFTAELNRLVKSTETTKEEYARRKSIIDEYVVEVGEIDKKAATAYSALEKWKTAELKKEADKREAPFHQELKRLTKSTETTQQEYTRRKGIIDTYVSDIGSENAKAAQAYAALEQWKTAELKKESDKRLVEEQRRDRVLNNVSNQIQGGSSTNPVMAEQLRHNQILRTLSNERKKLKLDEHVELARINALMEDEEARHLAATKEAQVAMIGMQIQSISSVADMASATVDLLTNGVEQIKAQTAEMTNTQKALFLVTQSIAAASALVNGIDLGMKMAAMFGNPALAAVGTALGATQAGAILGTTIAGTFDNGGQIPAGQVGIAAEYGDELINGVLVKGPATVTSREQTARVMNREQTGGGGSVINIYQNNTMLGDDQIAQITRNAANMGAQEGYNRVSRDMKNGRGIRQTMRKSIGV
ncbi:tail length tape measure protein [Vibrio phage D164]